MACVTGGCASLPNATRYVLTPPADGSAPRASPTAVPRLQVGPVAVPAFLDSTDIVIREGAVEVRASTTGRWAERLSSGLRDALVATLRARLPNGTLLEAPAVDTGIRYLSVTVTAFDVWTDGRVVLVAHWVLRAGRGGPALGVGEGTFRQSAAARAPVDLERARVTAMSAAVVDLATRLAGEVQSL